LGGGGGGGGGGTGPKSHWQASEVGGGSRKEPGGGLEGVSRVFKFSSGEKKLKQKKDNGRFLGKRPIGL